MTLDDEAPRVTVWAGDPAGGNVWNVSAVFDAYRSIRLRPTDLDDGDWEMEVDADAESAGALTARGRVLATVGFRGTTWTFRVRTRRARAADGTDTLTALGPGSLSVLSQCLAWRDPGLPADSQPEDPLLPKLYTGSAEAVCLSLIRDNWKTREGRPLFVPALPGGDRGLASRARPNNQTLRDIVVKKARTGGIRVGVELVPTAATAARLEVVVWVPANLTGSVTLSELTGSVGEWSVEESPPTLTKALVKGVGGIYRQVTTMDGIVWANDWGGDVEGLVTGPESYDAADLVQAGQEAIADGGPRIDAALTAVDSEGLAAVRDFAVGDVVSAQIGGSLRAGVVSSMEISADPESGTAVVPTFGDADSDPLMGIAKAIRSANRRLRAQEERG